MELEDILSSSLETLYDFAPIAHSSPGGLFTYAHRPQDPDSSSLKITLSVPDTQKEHWSLHASNIWVAALYVADHISELDLPAEETSSPDTNTPPLRLIELGAGSGLPSILIAKCYPRISVIASDFPDAKLIHTLRENVTRNNVAQNCTVVPHAWGTDPSALLPPPADIVLAADTLWDPAQHVALLRTICAVLAHTPAARAHLVAGLHTGKYTLDAFFRAARAAGLVIVEATEREVVGAEKEKDAGRREWDVERRLAAGGEDEDEDERERRRWIVWSVLKWGDL
ncbi:hypothetical protein V8E52_003840 [Russula decolorans]